MLIGEGIDVFEACDGGQGVAIFQKNTERIDVVLLDMNMPGLESKEVLTRLTALRSQVPVIFSSGFPKEDFRGTLTMVSAPVFLKKPYRKRELLQTIAATLKANPQQGLALD